MKKVILKCLLLVVLFFAILMFFTTKIHNSLTQDVYLKCKTCDKEIVILCDYEHAVFKNKKYTEELPDMSKRCINLGKIIAGKDLFNVKIIFEGFRKGKKNALLQQIEDKTNWIYTQDKFNSFSTKSFCKNEYKEVLSYDICTVFDSDKISEIILNK
jgi:hypothetical protein